MHDTQWYHGTVVLAMTIGMVTSPAGLVVAAELKLMALQQ